MITVPDQDPAPSTDEWLTLAEIAAELRLSPATIRSWVAKGALPARRAGQRKWQVRRGDLDEMLREAADERRAPSQPPSGADRAATVRPRRRRDLITPPNRWSDTPEEQRADPEHWLGAMQHGWLEALNESRMAPPDAWFAGRLSLLAIAAARKAAALALFNDDEPMTWRSEPAVDDLVLSYELRPDGNRPGPPDLWAEFDSGVEALGRAMRVATAAPIRVALEHLSVTLQDLADEIRSYRGEAGNWQQQPPRSARSDAGRASDPGAPGTEQSVS